MIIGKRHLILAALIIALGAAVYLNWQFAPTEQIVDMSTNDSQAALLDDAQYAATKPVSSADASVYNEDAVETGSRESSFDKARKEREDTREEALDTLKDIIDDPALDSAQKSAAVEKSAQIVSNMEKEAAIEALVKAKGYSDCVVIISDAEINVIIPAKGEGLTAADVAVIRDVVVGQVDISPSNIKVIEAK